LLLPWRPRQPGFGLGARTMRLRRGLTCRTRGPRRRRHQGRPAPDGVGLFRSRGRRGWAVGAELTLILLGGAQTGAHVYRRRARHSRLCHDGGLLMPSPLLLGLAARTNGLLQRWCLEALAADRTAHLHLVHMPHSRPRILRAITTRWIWFVPS